MSKTSSDPTSATATSKLARDQYVNLDGGKDRKRKSMKKDANKELGSSPAQHAVSHTSENWLEIDILGLRRTLERKGKAWAIFELVQNAWDTDATRVDVTLTRPNKNGMSTLTCRDNAPEGYRDLSEAHTLFGSSGKKADQRLEEVLFKVRRCRSRSGALTVRHRCRSRPRHANAPGTSAPGKREKMQRRGC
jgi:hypothetical protein